MDPVITCQVCHDLIDHARQTLHDDIDKVLSHHGLAADVVIKIRDDERLADSSLSHLDRLWQWVTRRAS